MFWERRRKSDEKTYIIVKEQHGQFQLALGAQARSYRQLRPATTEAARLASKLNDGRYYVFQAVSVSEVLSPRAITRSLDDGTSHADGLIPASKADPLD